MVFRRELLPILLAAAFLLIVPGQALAAEWLPAESLTPAGSAADATVDPDGNAAAAWESDLHVWVAERPRGGPWGEPEDLTPAGRAGSPKIVALPNGELVAAWVVGNEVLAAGKPPGGEWSTPETISTACCLSFNDLVAGTNGTALAYWSSGEGPAQTAVRPPGAAGFDPPQDLLNGNSPSEVAVAPDGSALVVSVDNCSDSSGFDCVVSQYRPPGGNWGAEEEAGFADAFVTSLGLAGRSGAAPFTVAWGESSGVVRSADRSPDGVWSGSLDVPGTEAKRARGGPIPVPAVCQDSAFGCLDLASRGDDLAVVWQQGQALSGSVRAGSGDWADRESVGNTDEGDADPEAAIAADGTVATAWQAGPGRTGAVVRGGHRSAPGEWNQVDLGTPSVGEGQIDMGDVAADGDGDAITGFMDAAGTRAAGFDGAGPQFSAFSLPGSGSLTFSAAADDNWSGPPSISWLFGDGTGASGATVSHAYGSPGTFTATATATDAVGNATQQSGPVTVTQTPPPPGDPCTAIGGDTDKDGIANCVDDNNGAAKPVPFKTVNATVVSGEVFVKLPAGSASTSQAKPPKGFVKLEGAETIPVGSTLDTKRGRVKVRSAADTKRKTQTGQFFRGRFKIRQVRIKRRSKKLITDMRLDGSSFKQACRANRASISAKRKRSRKRVRRLFGDAKGSFRTSGRNAAATVRGTRWSVQDRCDGTKVTVQRGRVEVRDKVRRKTIIVRTGHTYLARLR